MSYHLHIALFFVLAFGVFLLPMSFSLRELFAPKDIEPLRLRLESKDLAYFALQFEKELALSLPDDFNGGFREEHEGTFGPNIPFEVLSAMKDKQKNVKRLLISAGPLELPGGVNFHREIYSHSDLFVGERSKVYAAYARHNLHVESGSKVKRWIHAGNLIQIAPEVEVTGRTSCDGTIQFSENTVFSRARARRIELAPFPSAEEMQTEMLALAIAYFNQPLEYKVRRVVGSDLVVGPGEEIFGDLVVRGNLRLCHGAKVWGSVKTHRSVWIEDGVCIRGNVVAMDSAYLGPEVWVRGAVVTEQHLVLGKLSVLGSPEIPTTLVCQELLARSGVTVFGTISSRRARVRPELG